MSAEEENELARRDHLERLRLKHEAYVTVFGTVENPNPVGAVVLEDIDRFCKRGQESIHMDAEGRMDPFTTIYRDGKRSVADRIHAMIEWQVYGNSIGNVDGG